jgi:hypothetical protein
MKTARAHRKFAIYSGFLDTILEGEEEILDGETRKDTLKRILKDLEETAADLRKEAMRGDIIQETVKGAMDNFPPIGPPMPQVIDYKQKETLEIAIDNATSLEELQAIKDANPVMTVPILKHCNRRMEELMNEKSFTNGLG